jgi:hypothetical protein
VTIGVVVLLVASAGLALFPSIPAVSLMLAVALVPALCRPLLTARLNDLIPSAQRATILSLSALLFELGLAVAMPLLLACADRFGPPAAIGVATAALALTVLPFLFVWRTSDRTGASAARA